ncbi:MAG TPA: hypothetical protein H9808_08475 [Candidatus Atopostipes pullistercoris]|uniref:Uncharacterized protein n=1 Tax=Candidatus Atopostipes pullistercoris TaxID=2838467 RepID=A0A9D2G2B1_9LACT|nr:hypothetical protein [Candidatus Atopostipes pullistercoris]
MEKMLNAMLNAQKEMALEKNATEVELEIITGVLEEVAGILQDLISECKFEEAKGFLNDCSKLQQKKEELEILLENKQNDYAALEDMIKEAKRLVSKYEIDDTECEEEEETFSLEDLFTAIGFFSM